MQRSLCLQGRAGGKHRCCCNRCDLVHGPSAWQCTSCRAAALSHFDVSRLQVPPLRPAAASTAAPGGDAAATPEPVASPAPAPKPLKTLKISFYIFLWWGNWLAIRGQVPPPPYRNH